MPLDNPDWTNRVATPAQQLASTTVTANTTSTVYNGAVPPGTHSLKVFVESADPNFNAALVKVIDPSNSHVIQQFTNPVGVNLVVQIDDICTPNIRVDVTAPAANSTRCVVVAYLSDQAVFVDNDLGNPIPVTMLSNTALKCASISAAVLTTADLTVIPGVGTSMVFVHRMHLTSEGATGTLPVIGVRDIGAGTDTGGQLLITGAGVQVADTDYDGVSLTAAGHAWGLHNYDSVTHTLRGFVVYEQH